MERMTAALSNWWPWTGNINAAGEPESREERISRAMRPYEAFVVRLQSLLIWENPVVSCIFVVAVNLLYWLVVTLEFRFYSVASLVMLFVFIYNLWVEQIWPEIRVAPQETPDSEGWTPLHPGVLSVPEISQHVSRVQNVISTVYSSAKTLRQEQPGRFCAVACSALLILLLVGRTVSGAVLLYFALMAVILLPGACIHLLPADTMDRVEEVRTKLMGIKSVIMCEEKEGNMMTDSDSLIPDVTPEDLSLMNFNTHDPEDEEIAKLLPAGEISCIQENDDKLHSLTPSFSYMPAHDEDSMDCADLPIDQPGESLNRTLTSPPEDRSGIRFRSRHFNGDDSSDDDSFSKGLAFSDANVAPVPERQELPSLASLGPFGEMISRAAVENVAKSLVDAMTSVAHSVVATGSGAPTSKPQNDSGSEDELEDFEIINQEDLPKFS